MKSHSAAIITHNRAYDKMRMAHGEASSPRPMRRSPAAGFAYCRFSSENHIPSRRPSCETVSLKRSFFMHIHEDNRQSAHVRAAAAFFGYIAQLIIEYRNDLGALRNKPITIL
jgi:hypothetical protein